VQGVHAERTATKQKVAGWGEGLSGTPWFRRRQVGLGWRPVTWQGWLITAASVAVMIGVVTSLRGAVRLPVLIVVVVAYTGAGWLTGGRFPEPVAEPVDDEPAQRVAPGPSRPARARRAVSGPSSGDRILSADRLTKRFGERLAVDEVSLEIATGEVFGFLGPNGAGKTTTVRMLGTLIAPTSGEAMVAGLALDPANGTEIRQRIAVMPENPGLYLRLTAAENLEFFAGLYGLDDQAGRIRTALAAVNLADRANDLCGNLSKGLRQRVGLARALLNDPAILFLDEPTSGLDPVATREVHDLIEGLRDRGVTVFLTTHRLEEAERLCDRVAILNTRLRIVGTPAELRDRLFSKTLLVRTAAPLGEPDRVLSGAAGVESWRREDSDGYVLTVSDATTAAPAVARALVAAGADILSIAESRHSLEDIYLQLIDDDVEAAR